MDKGTDDFCQCNKCRSDDTPSDWHMLQHHSFGLVLENVPVFDVVQCAKCVLYWLRDGIYDNGMYKDIFFVYDLFWIMCYFLCYPFQSRWHIRILFIEILSFVVYAFLVDFINKWCLLAFVMAIADLIMKWYFLKRVRSVVLRTEYYINLNERRHMRHNCCWSCM